MESSDAPTVDLSEVSQNLGHYKILGKLGQGGMGVVYDALDQRLGRRVALKVLPAQIDEDVERLERFRREARIVAGLSHPNIVTLHSIESEGETHFLTMELIDGISLDSEIVRGRATTERFFELAIPLTDALAVAHEQGVVHRDLKPGNLMIGSDGRLTVLDFGIARLVPSASDLIDQNEVDRRIEDGDFGESSTASTLEAQTYLTKTGALIGTVKYMSPEQARGRAVDARSDVFNLGILFYEMLGGRHPFERSTSIGTLTAILSEEPPRLDGLRKDVPKALVELIRECLEKDPAARPETAEEVRERLKTMRDHSVSDSKIRRMSRIFASALLLASGLFFLLRTGDVLRGLFVDSTPVAPKAEEPAALPPKNLEAYGLYLEGRSHWNRRSPESFERAVELLRQAIEIDPELAEAHACLAAVYLHLSDYGKNSQDDSAERARSAALKAVEIAPNSSSARAELGFVYWAFEEQSAAEEELRQAVALDPKNARAHYVRGFVLQSAGDLDGAVIAWETARRLDPEVAAYHSNLGEAYLEYGQFQKARESIERVVDLSPNWPFIPRDYGRLASAERRFGDAVEAMRLGDRIGRTNSEAVLLAEVHHLLGDFEAELNIVRQPRVFEPDTVDFRIREASALIGLGRFDEAEILFAQFEEQKYVLGLYFIAAEAMAHGDPQRSRGWMERALAIWSEQSSQRIEDGLIGASMLEVVAPERVAEAVDVVLKRDVKPADEMIAAFLRSLAQTTGVELIQGILEAERLGADADQRLDGMQRLHWQAMAFAALGENERAVESLGMALDSGLNYDVWAHSNPIWRSLYDDPRYRDLLRSNSLPVPPISH